MAAATPTPASDDPETVELRYGVFVNEEVVAGFLSKRVADGFIDMLCGTVGKGTLIELYDGSTLLGGFDREGRELHPVAAEDEPE